MILKFPIPYVKFVQISGYGALYITYPILSLNINKLHTVILP
jgi:hypothetical protein